MRVVACDVLSGEVVVGRSFKSVRMGAEGVSER